MLTGGARLPRSVQLDEVRGLAEDGVSCDIAESGMAKVTPTSDPEEETFVLDDAYARAVIGFIGLVRSANLGIAP